MMSTQDNRTDITDDQTATMRFQQMTRRCIKQGFDISAVMFIRHPADQELADIWIDVDVIQPGKTKDFQLLRDICNDIITHMQSSIELQLWSDDAAACPDEIVGRVMQCEIDDVIAAFGNL